MPAPLLLAGVSMGASAIGTGLSLYGNYQANLANEKKLKEMKNVAGMNFGFAKNVALQNYNAGKEQIDQFKDQGETALASNKALDAVSGVGGTGSQALIGKFSRNNLSADVDQLRENNLQNYTNAMRQAELDYEGAKVGYSGGSGFAAQQVGTLLSGVSSLYSQGLQSGMISPYNKTTAPTGDSPRYGTDSLTMKFKYRGWAR